VAAKPESRVIVNKLCLVNPITREKFGDSVTVVCEVTKIPKTKVQEPPVEPVIEDDGKARILGDIGIDAQNGISMIDNLLNNMGESSEEDLDDDELSDIDQQQDTTKVLD
jgi:hypothetical protein